MDQIATAEPRPLRQINDTIPRELDRICQKARRQSGHRSTVQHRPRHWLRTCAYFLQTEAASGSPTAAAIPGQPDAGTDRRGLTPNTTIPGRSDSSGRDVKIVPKGLRSFDRHDADFFLELLPGPRATARACPKASRFLED